ncbi:chitinase [Paenibacillus shirakamiensis]|uniref:chitinase n=1 Tax=Paenibacillus shirakamiensis TaxID=1265935 RepID=A0ABS4JD22_9BACL|nr:glycosyl hydrolase family 18 protein [Paenibacillus shirakamiensis]MBP1999622.1 chitinase [Paenibacillus shirakamiensis]
MRQHRIGKTALLVWMSLLVALAPFFQSKFTPTASAAAATSNYKIVGYFPSWGIYGRSYNVSDIDVSKVTHINYAFADICWNGKHGNPSTDPANPNKQTWPCTTTGIPLQSGTVPNGSIVLGDPDADALRPTAGGPTTGCWADAACGNFGALRNLKAKNPQLKTILSVGGWTWSNRFSDTAATDATRKTFAKSAVDALRAYGFDGVDLDWEYPNVEAIPGNSYSPADKQNYTLLLQEIRNQLDAAGEQDGKHYLLTIASGASQKFVDNTELTKIAQLVDWINIMTYDFHGGSWEGTTSHNTGLYADPNDPYLSMNFTVDGAINAYQNAGVPLNKIVLGLEFMGRSWKNCPGGPNNDGQFQTCTPDTSQTYKWSPVGTWDDTTSGNTGVFDYGDIAANYVNKNGYTRFWNDKAKVPYLYNPTTKIFISYDDTESLGYKTAYIKNKYLGGAMFWEFSSDCRVSPKFSCSGPKLLDKVYSDLNTGTAPVDTAAPTAPTSLTSSSHTDKKVTLSWSPSTDNVGVMSYDIYQGNTLIKSVDGATTSALVKGFTGSTSYTFTVKAKDAAGNSSAASNAITVVTSPPIVDNTAPSVPANLTVVAKTKTSVTLSWTASTDNDDIGGYDIYQNGTLVKSTANTKESITGLTAGTTYSFYIKAKDLSNNASAASTSLSVTTQNDPNYPVWQLGATYAIGSYVTYNGVLYKCTYAHTAIAGWEPSKAPTLWSAQDAPPTDTQAPTAPAGLTATASSGTSVALTWTAASDNLGVTGYDIYQGSNLIGSSATTSYSVTGLAGGSAYSFTVKAKDAAGNVSAASNAASVTLAAADTVAPTAPGSLTVSAKTSTTATLTWTASTDNVAVTGYDVYKGTTLATSVAGNVLTASVSGLTPSTAYTFTVKAKDGAGNTSGASSAATVTTDAPSSDKTAPSVPTGLTVSSKNQTSITLTWTASTDNVGVTGYDVYKGTTLAASVSGTSLTSVISGLTANTAYTFTVVAKDAAGNASAASSVLSVTTDSAAPAAPAWVANKAYVKDDLVTYAGKVYKCTQPHTSLPGWEPSNVPALWTVQP